MILLEANHVLDILSTKMPSLSSFSNIVDILGTI